MQEIVTAHLDVLRLQGEDQIPSIPHDENLMRGIEAFEQELIGLAGIRFTDGRSPRVYRPRTEDMKLLFNIGLDESYFWNPTHNLQACTELSLALSRLAISLTA